MGELKGTAGSEGSKVLLTGTICLLDCRIFPIRTLSAKPAALPAACSNYSHEIFLRQLHVTRAVLFYLGYLIVYPHIHRPYARCTASVKLRPQEYPPRPPSRRPPTNDDDDEDWNRSLGGSRNTREPCLPFAQAVPQAYSARMQYLPKQPPPPNVRATTTFLKPLISTHCAQSLSPPHHPSDGPRLARYQHRYLAGPPPHRPTSCPGAPQTPAA